MNKRLLCIAACVQLLLLAAQVVGAWEWRTPNKEPKTIKSLPLAKQQTFTSEDALNLACLKEAYAEIRDVITDAQGIWLVLGNEKRVLYAAHNSDLNNYVDSLDCDVRSSMEQIYPLEPLRPSTPPGFAPGRKRPYALFYALYGNTARDVQTNLERVSAFGITWRFAPAAAEAFRKSALQLAQTLQYNPSLRSWLKNNGTFKWRFIAHEKVLSAHSFG
ncbi:MAG: hypothetical protein IJU79_05445 [Desulfovibrionaceae bacterium]|nr:hypothetical protein [Desulfovibrionaceae bacterium]